MTLQYKGEYRRLELAFESSCAIVKLAGLEGNEELNGLRKRIIAGELGFDEAVRIVVGRLQSDHP